MDISNLLSCHKSSIVPPRLDPLLGSLGLHSHPSTTWSSWTKSYCVTPAGGTRWVKCMWCECMRMFPHLCFQRCDLPHRSWVTWISIHTFSRYLNGPRWDDVRNTGTEPRAVEWRIPVSPKRVLVPPTRMVPGMGRWRVGPDVTSPESEMFREKVNVLCVLRVDPNLLKKKSTRS